MTHLAPGGAGKRLRDLWGGRAAEYSLDEQLSVAEATCRFPANGLGRESVEEGFYAIAIRRSGELDCIFRFSPLDGGAARLMVESLNR